MPVAIKISTELAEAARTEAVHADRSLTGQIEHWAKLGRIAEAQMTAPVVQVLKRTQGRLDEIEDPQIKSQVLAAFESFHHQSPEKKRSLMGLDKQVRFEPDPDKPGSLIRITPDGQRRKGRMEGRRFVPIQE